MTAERDRDGSKAPCLARAGRPWPRLVLAALPPAARPRRAASSVRGPGRSHAAPILGDPIVYEVTLSLPDGRAEGYRAPDFRGFRVLGEYPSQSTQIQMGGGSQRHAHGVHLALRAVPVRERPTDHRAGPGAGAAARELRTAPIAITVAAGASGRRAPRARRPTARRTRQRPRRPRAAGFAVRRSVRRRGRSRSGRPGRSRAGRPGKAGSFIRAVADKRKVYVGEQVVVRVVPVPDRAPGQVPGDHRAAHRRLLERGSGRCPATRATCS